MLIPFLWMISTSLKIPTEVFSMPPQWIPWPPQWINYVSAWAPKGLPETFNTYLKNTLIITFFNTLGAIVSSSFVAFGFARLKFKGRDFMFILLLGTMMIPVQVTMIPQFILFRSLGWIDTFLPLIVPNFFAISAFNVFLLRQFFMTLPPELDEAALIDGCNYFDIYWRIIMPLSWPVVATIAVFSFVYNWNDFLNPLIYLNSSSNFTLALGLQTFTTVYGSSYHLMMAASMLMLLPIIVVFFIGQKYFIEGIATTGLKG
ncbi:MAG: carbohydrate ABC transporter permease [Candidatus Firestonebacteria bacterium]|nr:carbohydrate ABC transporter permease [Candidatus Firestonebacteria bacterium]